MDDRESMLEKEEIPEEQREQLIMRVTDLARRGILKPPDWFKIYGILIEACEREKADTMEQMLMQSLEEGEGNV